MNSYETNHVKTTNKILEAKSIPSTAEAEAEAPPSITEAIDIVKNHKVHIKKILIKQNVDLQFIKIKQDIFNYVSRNLANKTLEAKISMILQDQLDQMEDIYYDEIKYIIDSAVKKLTKEHEGLNVPKSTDHNIDSSNSLPPLTKQLQELYTPTCESINTFCQQLKNIWNARDKPSAWTELKTFANDNGIIIKDEATNKSINELIETIGYDINEYIQQTHKSLNSNTPIDNTKLFKTASGSYCTVHFISGNELASSTPKDSKTNKLHRQYVIKEQKWPAEPEEQEKNLAEVKHGKELGSTIKVYGHKVQDGISYILMDCGGYAITGLIKKKSDNTSSPVDQSLVKTIMIPIAKQLETMHAQDIIHSDIKSDNILIDPATGKTEIIDFGIAISKNTQHDVLAGSPGYLPPELKDNTLPYSKKVDTFAFGVVLAELLTGKKTPLQPDYLFKIFVDDMPQAIAESIEKVAECCGKDSDAVDLITNLLEANPEKRYSIDDALAHPFFTKTKSTPYIYLQQQLESKISDMDNMENTDLSNVHKKQLQQDINQIQNSLKWLDLESNKKTLLKRLDKTPVDNNSSLNNMIAELTDKQAEIIDHTGKWLEE